MGRGLSEKQLAILGLAARIADVHGLGVGRGTEFDFVAYQLTGKVMCGCEIADITQPVCVHHVWNIPIAETVTREPAAYQSKYQRFPAYRCAYEQTNPGHFDNKMPGVNAAKVGASKSVKRLLSRDLLRHRLYEKYSLNYPRGYVITPAGYEIGKQHMADIDESTVRRYFEHTELWYRGLDLK